MEITDKVFNTIKLAGEPLSVGQIVTLSGLDKKDVEKAMKQLKDEERISSPKRCYWDVNIKK